MADNKTKLSKMIQDLKDWKKDLETEIDFGEQYYSYERLRLAKTNIVKIEKILKGEENGT